MLKNNLALRRILAFILALVLVFPMMNEDVVRTEAATATVSSVKVTNLPSNKLTLAKGKSKVLKVAVATTASSVSKDYTYTSSNTSVATVKKATGGVSVKAIKNGSTTITITSKINKSKKAVIYVTVGTPVTSVKLNKTTASVYDGNSMTLKATVGSSKASNKGVIWSSSNKAIATVSSSGKVTGVKEGSVTIKATAADGSGKVATCTVKVLASNQITGIRVMDDCVIKVALKYAQAIPEANWSVKSKDIKSDKYRSIHKIEYVENVNNKVYYIYLNNNLSGGEYVQVSVKGLKGSTAAKSKEGKYSLPTVSTYEKEKIYSMTYGEAVCYKLGEAYETTYKAENLPSGVKLVVEDCGYAYLKGTPSKTGTFNFKIKKVSNYNNKNTITEGIALVYSPTKIAAENRTYYVYHDLDSYKTTTTKTINAVGGSGKYTYEVLDNVQDVTINQTTGKFTFKIAATGTFNFKIKVTDANNSSISAVAQYTFKVEDTKKAVIKIKDAEGKDITSNATVYFYNNKLDTRYVLSTNTSSYYSSNGGYVGNVTRGKYNILVKVGNTYRMLLEKSINQDTTFEVSVPVYKVTVDAGEATINYWYDEFGNSKMQGKDLYLKKGSYKWNSYQSDKIYRLNIKVTKSGVYKATVVENVMNENTKSLLVSSNAEIWYKFVPTKTQKYTVNSVGMYDTYITLYNADKTSLKSDDDSGYYNNFSLSYDLVAGQTYYLAVRLYNNTSSMLKGEGHIDISIR